VNRRVFLPCSFHVLADVRGVTHHKNVNSPTHKRIEGRARVWGSEFTTKGLHHRGNSAEFAAKLKTKVVLLRGGGGGGGGGGGAC
jgi:hypothetical protein